MLPTVKIPVDDFMSERIFVLNNSGFFTQVIMHS